MGHVVFMVISWGFTGILMAGWWYTYPTEWKNQTPTRWDFMKFNEIQRGFNEDFSWGFAGDLPVTLMVI